MNGIGINIPEKVFFSNDLANNKVKNDFYFTIYKINSEKGERLSARRSGEVYPTIYIKGFQKLFKNDEMQNAALDGFFKMFNSCGNKDWSIGYGKFRNSEEYCAAITCIADNLEMDFTVKLQLSDKCVFTQIPEALSPIELQFYIDDFDYFFSDIPNKIEYNITLERGFAVYIEQFGAYNGSKKQIKSVYKGEECCISWKIQDNQKASAFLYDENGSIVANLPPHTTIIDKDRKFTLTAYNDFCSVTQSIIVYRTLWKKDDAVPNNCPKTDNKGHFKFYQSFNNAFYLYVHPKLYCSTDLINWTILSENRETPKNFNYYHSSFNEYRMSVCYACDKEVTYYEYNFVEKVWTNCKFENENILSAQALLNGNKTLIILGIKSEIGIYEMKGNELINGKYMLAPDKAEITAIDTFFDKHSFMAVLCSNKRVYFYDFEDDFKNNIFECSDVKDNNLYIVKSNALYVLLNGYMFEVSDREKFTDRHYFPNFSFNTRPIIGGKDAAAISAILQTDTGMEVWKYKF